MKADIVTMGIQRESYQHYSIMGVPQEEWWDKFLIFMCIHHI